MVANPFVGLLFHWLGGLAAASFYLSYRGVRHWAWETYWLVGGIFSWIVFPGILAWFLTNDLAAVLRETPASVLFWTYFFGVLWGLGGLTFGLTMRYLGLSLGMAVVLGFCAAFGTLVPPIFKGEFLSKVLGTSSGLVILLGVAICVIGIAVAGWAGMIKERGLSEEDKQKVVKEFNFKKGLLVASFSGVMSACFSYGLAAGDPLKDLSLSHGTAPLWQGLPVLIVVLLGGFTTNLIWCLILNVRNGTGGQYLAVSRGLFSLGRNYLFCAVAGLLWYLQFFFYTMGESKMADYKFSSWTLHMASIIIFSSLWGLSLKEWKGASPRAMKFFFWSLILLILSTITVGYGNYLGSPEADRVTAKKSTESSNELE
jgi:L-rhamnose-H+ transport protein